MRWRCRRVDGIRFAAGIFTNLTRDHLDFHAGMDDYFAAKRRLFEMLPDDAPAVINIDDPRGASLVDVVQRPVTYGFDQGGRRLAWRALVLARRTAVRHPLSTRSRPSALEAGGQAERLQHPRCRRGHERARRADRGHRAGARTSRRRSRPIRNRVQSGRRRDRRRRLRPHRRCAAKPAGDGAPGGGAAARSRCSGPEAIATGRSGRSWAWSLHA